MFFPYERPSASLPGCGSPDAGVLSAAAALAAPLPAPSPALAVQSVPAPRGLPALPSPRTALDESPARRGTPGHDGGTGYARYGAAELARRIGVDPAALREWEEQAGWIGGSAASAAGTAPAAVATPATANATAPGPAAVSAATPYRAADVVRYEAMARLVRRGVPVARAAALVRAAETRRSRTDPVAATLPKINR